MHVRERPNSSGVASPASEAVATVRRWLDVPDLREFPAESRLADLLAIDGGADFAIDFIEGVLRPSDDAVAARNLEQLSRHLPPKLAWYAGFGMHLAGGFAPVIPAPFVPVARQAFLRSIGHLLVRLTRAELAEQLADLAGAGGIRPVLAPVMAVASGDHEARRQVTDALELLRHAGVDSLSLTLTGVVGRIRPLNLDGIVTAAVERLAPLFELAAASRPHKLIDLAVDRFDQLEHTLETFEELCVSFPQLTVSVSLPAHLPDSLPALHRVVDFAHARHASGGAPLTVRFTAGGRALEDIAAARQGWPSAALASETESDAQFLRLLDAALAPENSNAVRVVSASGNLFITAFAWRMARARHVEGILEHEFGLGVASKHREAVKRDVGGVRLRAPVVQAGQLPLACGYLIRRVGELAQVDLSDDAAFEAGADRFLAALEAAQHPATVTSRADDPSRVLTSDFSIPAVRDWGLGVLARARDSASGEALLAASAVGSSAELDERITESVASGRSWGERRASTRATVLDSVAEVLAERRGLLVETIVSEAGATLEEADGDVATAIGLALSAAGNARDLDSVDGAAFQPPSLVVVVPPRACPLTDLAGSVLSALAAGGAVVVKCAPESRRTAAVFIDTLAAAGVPSGLVSIVDDEGEFARELLSDDRVDHILHAGSRHTAKLFHSWRPETALSSTTGGRNSIIVTPFADLEAAVANIVDSGFDHAGQAPTASSTVILVGSAGESERFLGRLADAVASIPVGPGTGGSGPLGQAGYRTNGIRSSGKSAPTIDALRTGGTKARVPAISALARPAGPRELASLESLEPGESWRVRPRQLDNTGRLWSPGLRESVSPSSRFRVRENRVPVIGVVRVPSLAEAIEVQNSLGFGLAAGIQSLNADEVELWLASVHAGLLCVNRPIRSALRSRVAVGGWDRAVVGVGRPAGGQDAVLALGGWAPVDPEPGATVTLDGVGEAVARFITAAQPCLDFAQFDWVRAGARADARAWRDTFAAGESTRPDFERVVHRYGPVPVTIRVSEGATVAQLVRVLAAAALTGAPVAVSSFAPLPDVLIAFFGEPDCPVGVAEVLIESDARWHARVQASDVATSRIRLIGGDSTILARVLLGRIGVAVYADPVTVNGRIELLPFVRGQSVLINTERFGRPDAALSGVRCL